MQPHLLQQELFPGVLAEPPKAAAEIAQSIPDKAPGAFKTISEAAHMLEVPQHVLRFWEAKFSQIKPLKRSGGRRYYRPEDMDILFTIKNLLYKEGYTIKGAKKLFGARGKKPTSPRPAKAEKKVYSERQLSQLAVIRQELMGLRDILKPYISKEESRN